MESIYDRLKSLGVQPGASHLKPPEKKEQTFPIEKVLIGRDIPSSFGSIFAVENEFQADYIHGVVPLTPPQDFQIMAEWCRDPRLLQLNPQQIIFLDTETSGLAGGTGTFAFMVGMGYFTENGFHLIQTFMREPGEEPAFLAVLNQILTPFQAVVTFNGKAFDVPLLNTRHTLNGFTSPFPEFCHIDMLPLARRLWRNRLPNRALQNLETEILGLGRSDEEIPGWLIPELYFDYLHNGDARPLEGVFYHNQMDIVSLAALFIHVAATLNNPLANPSPEGLDLIAIARLYQDLGRIEAAIELYEHSLGLGLPETFYLDTLMRYAEIYRRQDQWEFAGQLWMKAAERGYIPGFVELAKYHEHHSRDITSAFRWTIEAIEVLERKDNNDLLRGQWAADLSRRRERLAARLKRSQKE